MNGIRKSFIFFLCAAIFIAYACVIEKDNKPSVNSTPQGHPTPTDAGDTKVFYGTGVALTPRNFPSHTNRDVEDMFTVGKDLGKYAAFIYQWSDPNLLKAARVVTEKSKKYGYNVVLGISPTILQGMRDKLDLPKSVRSKAGKNLSFSNPAVHKPFTKAVYELTKLKPPYLCIATEINFLAISSVQEYLHFARIYKKLYPNIKKISPNTKVFVSFQWDIQYIALKKEPNKIKEHKKVIDVFRPELDIIAFTSYPSNHYSRAKDIPNDYYSSSLRYLNNNDQIMFMEIGWPAQAKSNADKQKEFITVLPSLMKDLRQPIVIWSLLHDVKFSDLTEDLSTTGLLNKKGDVKPAFKAFQELKHK
jgi:hypothetical protein